MWLVHAWQVHPKWVATLTTSGAGQAELLAVCCWAYLRSSYIALTCLPPLRFIGQQVVLEACRTRSWCSLALQLLAAAESLGRQLTVGQIDAALAACAASGAVQEVGAALACQRVARSLMGVHLLPLQCPCLPQVLLTTPSLLLRPCTAHVLPMQAREVFGKLAKHGLSPSPASHAALAEAQCAAGQWGDAVQEYEALVHSR